MSSIVVRDSLDALLLHWLKNESDWSESWQTWAKHTLLGAGKALRPQLVFDFYRAAGGDAAERPSETIVRLGLAVEFLHTYTLIHDDLPCMDNDDFRRGRPTLHRLQGEALAVLMGDALQAAAFQVLANTSLSATNRLLALQKFSKRVGAAGLIEGQRLDIQGQAASFQDLRRLHELKTGELFALSCELGVLAAARVDLLGAAASWGKSFGLLFQIHDDLLDRSALRSEMGKTPLKDQHLDRKTIFDFMNAPEIREFTQKSTEAMKTLTRDFPSAQRLNFFAEDLQQKIKSLCL